MQSKFDFETPGEDRMVYVREIAVTDLPMDVQAQVEGLETLYAVHGADGERLAVVKERTLAFDLARQHDYAPVTVH
ncbi:MAG: DUF1150 family protein [Cognatishimia sp.]|uniref:DUF1150 family protein n=1 Tax=Cognatishimia sp. TaxID=2211648 RepID=UPI004057EC88